MTMMHGLQVRLDNAPNTNYIITKQCKSTPPNTFLHNQHHRHHHVLQSTQSTSHNLNKSHHHIIKSKFTKRIIFENNIFRHKEILLLQVHISQQRRTTKHTMITVTLNTQPALIHSYSTL